MKIPTDRYVIMNKAMRRQMAKESPHGVEPKVPRGKVMVLAPNGSIRFYPKGKTLDAVNALNASYSADVESRAALQRMEEELVADLQAAGKPWYHLTKIEQGQAEAEGSEMEEPEFGARISNPLLSALTAIPAQGKSTLRAMVKARVPLFYRSQYIKLPQRVPLDVDELAAMASLCRQVSKADWAGKKAKQDAKKVVAYADKVKRSL